MRATWHFFLGLRPWVVAVGVFAALRWLVDPLLGTFAWPGFLLIWIPGSLLVARGLFPMRVSGRVPSRLYAAAKPFDVVTWTGRVTNRTRSTSTDVSTSYRFQPDLRGGTHFWVTRVGSVQQDDFTLVDEDGDELNVRLSGQDLALADGQVATVAWLSRPLTTDRPFLMLRNHSTRTIHDFGADRLRVAQGRGLRPLVVCMLAGMFVCLLGGGGFALSVGSFVGFAIGSTALAAIQATLFGLTAPRLVREIDDDADAFLGRASTPVPAPSSGVAAPTRSDPHHDGRLVAAEAVVLVVVVAVVGGGAALTHHPASTDLAAAFVVRAEPTAPPGTTAGTSTAGPAETAAGTAPQSARGSTPPPGFCTEAAEFLASVLPTQFAFGDLATLTRSLSEPAQELAAIAAGLDTLASEVTDSALRTDIGAIAKAAHAGAAGDAAAFAGAVQADGLDVVARSAPLCGTDPADNVPWVY